MENIANVKLFIQSLSSAITNYSNSLTPLQNKSLTDLLASIESPSSSSSSSSSSSTTSSARDQITLLNNYAYVLISTLFAYLKSIGVDTDSHPIKKELSRVRESMQRLKTFDLDDKQREKLALEEAKKEQAKKEYMNRVIGVKGGDANINTANDNLKGPAISKKNFQGVHKRFEEELIENLPELLSESDAKGGISKDIKQEKKVKKEGKVGKDKSKIKSKTSGKVTKPKHIKKTK